MKLRIGRVILTLAGTVVTFILLVTVISIFFPRNPSDNYTIRFLNSCDKEELMMVTNKGVSGIIKDGEFVEPSTNEDRLVLSILNIANGKSRSVLMQMEYREVDEENIRTKIKVINQKFPEREFFIGIEDGEKRIFSYPKGYKNVPDNIERV